jgi:hypothetical protein
LYTRKQKYLSKYVNWSTTCWVTKQQKYTHKISSVLTMDQVYKPTLTYTSLTLIDLLIDWCLTLTFSNISAISWRSLTLNNSKDIIENLPKTKTNWRNENHTTQHQCAEKLLAHFLLERKKVTIPERAH